MSTKIRITFLISMMIFIGRVIGNSTLNCNSCLYLYFNISNCVNCNSFLAPLVKDEYLNKHYKLFYVLDESYRAKGSRLLSEYLKVNILEENICYNDSIITLIKDNSNAESCILFLHDEYKIFFDISKTHNVTNYFQQGITDVISIDTFLINEILSQQLYIDIIGSDTFVIDLVLGNLYKNRIKIIPELYIWDIPDLVTFPLENIDSTNTIFRIELNNIKKINNTYLVFCNGNQLIRDNKNLDNINIYPRSMVLMFDELEFISMTKFKSVILNDEKGCYFDDYAIFQIKEVFYIVSECGLNKLKPRLSLMKLNNGKIVTEKSRKINISKDLSSSKGYTSELGNNIIYFIGRNKIFTLENNINTVTELFDFSSVLKMKEYVIASTDVAFPDYKILIKSGSTYKLINNLYSFDNDSKEVIPYIIIYNDSKLKKNISNSLYIKESNKFMFINNLGQLVSLKIL